MTCNQFPPKPLLAEAGLSCPSQRLPFSAYWCPAKPHTSPSAPPPTPPGSFCWWQCQLISAYLAPTLRTDTGTIGNIWPRDAESGEMEAMGEKEGWQYERVIQRGGRKCCLSQDRRDVKERWGILHWALGQYYAFLSIHEMSIFWKKSGTYSHTRINWSMWKHIVFLKESGQLRSTFEQNNTTDSILDNR